MDNIVIAALEALPVSDLNYTDWIKVGMALKDAGYPLEVWDEWSRNDSRYHVGECEKKWNTFQGAHSPVKAGTIVAMAKRRGWESKVSENRALAWNDSIEFDGFQNSMTMIDDWNPVKEFETYIRLMFQPEDIVNIVSNDVWLNKEGRWSPAKGVFYRTAGEYMEAARKYPNDLGAVIGDWKEEAGAWVRINPLDGKGVKNENVTSYRHALVESDTMPVDEQERLFRRERLPITVLTHSAGKSLHAMVKVDASSAEEYQQRVKFLYDYLEKRGLTIDKQNSNPSRLSRLPGVTRNGKRQYIVDTNIGCKSWDEWVAYIDANSDNLPGVVRLSSYVNNPPKLPDELIKGILRRGHKMLISGSSKAGKSFLLMELCIAIAEGTDWLGFRCRKGKVLFVNLEIDSSSAINRFLEIYEALGIPPTHTGNISIWNLRGYALTLDKLVPKLLNRVKDEKYEAIIIDPIYKVITGDENNATAMAHFVSLFDRICMETGASIIYCHHHSKGAQGAKRAMDRASGSGVFARDPDAQLDMIELALSDDIKNNIRDGQATGWRLESSLREFPNIKPVNFWYEYPVHRVDKSGVLNKAPAQGTYAAGRVKNTRSKTSEESCSEFRNAFAALSFNGIVKVKDIAEYLGCSDKTVYARLKKLGDEFILEGRGKIRQLRPN